MDRIGYQALRKQLQKEGWMARSDRHGLLVSALELTQVTLTLAVLAQVEPWSLLYGLLQVWLAVSLFRCFVLVHECGHATLFASRTLNRWAGRVFGVLSLVPADNWRHVHFQHHIWVGVVDKDPTAVGILDVKGYSPRLRRFYNLLWKLRLPLAAIGGVFKAFWLYPLVQWRAGQPRRALYGLLSSLFTLLPWCIAGYWFGLTGLLVWVGPALLLYYVWFECINLTHHAGLYTRHSASHPQAVPLHEQAVHCRTARLPAWFSLLTCYHFNLHTEHHLFPTIPWHRVPALKERLAQQAIAHYTEVDFLAHMRRIRAADPFELFIDSAPSQ